MAQYTDFLGITKLEPGQQQAHVVANEAFDNYDLALAGLAVVDLAGKSDYSMSGRESTHAVLRLVNSDRDCLVTIQARPKTWTIINDSARAVRIRTDFPNSAPLAVGAGLVLKVICDGTAMRAASDGLSQLEAHNQSPAAHNSLTAARTYYLRSGGSDQNDGLTVATPLATVNGAKAKLRQLKTNGFAVTLDLGPGVWPAMAFTEGELGDTAALTINGAGDQLTTVSGAGYYAVRFYNINACVTLQNFGFNSGTYGIESLNVKRLNINKLRFGACGSHQVYLQRTYCVTGAGLVIDGGAATAFACCNCSFLRVGQAITINGAPHFSTAFTYCSGQGYSNWVYATFSGTATGIRYQSELSGFILSGGGGANYFPGSLAGVTATGGYYA